MTVGRFKFVIWTSTGPDPIFKTLSDMYSKYEWQYYHAALEYCPDTGKEHIDGYYEYNTPRRVSNENKKFTKYFGKGFGDLQIAYGTAGENQDYSQKEGLRFETQGTPGKGQGHRTDLDTIKDQIIDGTTNVDTIAIQNPMVFHQYGRTLRTIEDISLRKQFRTEMTRGVWYYGPTGTGKSEAAFEGYHPDTHYVWKNDKGWQDGYTGQATVILNDFRGELKYNELLQLVDKWPYSVPRRAREPAPFLAKTVIVTSSLKPSQIYHRRAAEDSLDQLLRRFVIYQTASGQRPSITSDHFIVNSYCSYSNDYEVNNGAHSDQFDDPQFSNAYA